MIFRFVSTMEYQVIYFSRGGNTKKIADAIASEIGVQAEDVKGATLKKDTFLFLGSGSYGSKPGKPMTQFIDKHLFTSRNVALFGTSGGGEGKEVQEMETQLTSKEATVKGRFFCKGKFMLFSRGRPNQDDIHEAKQFAKRMI